MSKKQLIKDNLLVFIGGNIASGLNFILNFALLRIDEKLFNLYTAYTSVALILLVPSLVTMRVFTVFGNPVIENIRRFYLNNKNKVLSAFIVLAILFFPLNYLLTQITEEGNFITSVLLIALSIIGLIANVFRGIRQNEEDYKTAVISINLEAIGRVVLGFLFAVVLKMGISGILLGHILGFAASLLICFDKKQVARGITHNDEIRLKNVFFSTFFMTLGLEFFSNFDIIYADNVLENSSKAQTEFNTLQLFRKIIFFGTFAVSSVILSLGGKNRHTKKFMFGLTLLLGFIIGIGFGGFFYLIKDILFSILKTDISLISPSKQVLFLVATTLMSSAYLLANWLFSLKKLRFVYLPIVASAIQFIIFITFGKDLDSLLNAFTAASAIFFGITFASGLGEALNIRDNVVLKEAN